MKAHLNDSTIKTTISTAVSQKQRLELRDLLQAGLCIRMTPNGTSTWSLSCRDQQGRMRRYEIGRYPVVGIAEARKKARSLHVNVRENGADPVAEGRRRRMAGTEARDGLGTLKALLTQYGEAVGKTKKSWQDSRRRIETVFKAQMEVHLSVLKASDLQIAADAYPARQSAAAAVRYVRPVLKWGAKRNHLSLEIATIEPPATVKVRDRVLSSAELGAILPKIGAADSDPYRRAFRFLLLTLARREEVSGATWRDIDLAACEWTIPGTESKNGKAHRVPLSSQAVALLKSVTPGEPDDLVFRTPAKRGGNGRLANWDRETKRLMAETKTLGWTRHDLRRTGATLLGELGLEPHVIEAALNHMNIYSGLAATYNKARYLPAVREALQRLANRLDEVEFNSATAVIPPQVEKRP
jgi:integrase